MTIQNRGYQETLRLGSNGRATETDAMQAKVLTDDEARRVAVEHCEASRTAGTQGMIGGKLGLVSAAGNPDVTV
jgi:hypothetical protein